MSFLLDTNVISEGTKPNPDLRVRRWLSAVDELEIFLSIVTFAEIAQGVELLPHGLRRQRLARWLHDDLPARFDRRILGIDLDISAAWGELMARSQQQGIATSTIDGFLAATAIVFDLTLVTRNVKDFDPLGVKTFNPWHASEP